MDLRDNPMAITKDDLKRADPKNVRRLAAFLGIPTQGLSDRHVIKILYHYLRRTSCGTWTRTPR